jgi:hypothetical protein
LQKGNHMERSESKGSQPSTGDVLSKSQHDGVLKVVFNNENLIAEIQSEHREREVMEQLFRTIKKLLIIT